MQKQNSSTEYTLPDGFELRLITLEDSQAIADVFNAHHQALVGRDNFSAETVRSMLTDPVLDMERDARVITNENNEIVAYLAVWSHPPHVQSTLHGAVHSDYVNSTAQRILINWGEQIALENIERAPADALVFAKHWSFKNDQTTQSNLTEAGFKHVRNSWRMGIDLDQPIPEAVFPANTPIKTFPEIDNDLTKVYRAVDESFRDHHGHVDRPEEEGLKDFQHWMDSYPNVDTNYWYVAMDGDEIAGMSLCLPYMIGEEHVGHVDTLGVLKNWRRQGIALNLLYHSFRELQAIGQTKVTLEVDASSLTGATYLYEKAGMRVIEQEMAWEKVLRDGVDYRTQQLEG